MTISRKLKQLAIVPALISSAFAANAEDNFEQAYQSIAANELATHVKEIASDKFMGRCANRTW